MHEYNNILKIVFGFDELKDFQKKVVASSFENEDIVVISPTGSGKSLCFQLPALMSEGITIVLSPLKSLIYDQVENLKKKDISCNFLNSDLTEKKKNLIFGEFKKKQPNLKLLYTTPESIFCNDEIKEYMKNLYDRNLISRFVLDEAHCISTWGHDFRPNYLKVRKIKSEFSNIPIIALTATATERVKNDIIDILNFEKYKIFQTSFLKTNLNINIRNRGCSVKDEQFVIEEISNELKNKYKGQSGILYAFSRAKCETISSELKNLGVNSEHYHAGLSAKKRNEIQNLWLENKIQIICATIAFGMGIDKPDVRIIYHFNVPQNVENYYQEIGRGGRDKKRTDCILYYNDGDAVIYNILNNKKGQNRNKYYEVQNLELQKYERRKIYDMINFCQNKYDCRHIALCNYFGEKRKEKIGFCNDLCDICKLYHINKIKPKKINVTEDTIKIIKLISTIREPSEKNIISKIMGYPQKIDKRRLKKTFGNNEKWLKYKSKYEKDKLNIQVENEKYNNKIKLLKRIILNLTINKYINIELFKRGNGKNRIWHEEYTLYEKSKKILNNKKKIYV